MTRIASIGLLVAVVVRHETRHGGGHEDHKGHKGHEEKTFGFVLFVNFVIFVPLPSARLSSQRLSVSAYDATD